MSETERAAWIIKRTQELTAQGLGWSKAMRSTLRNRPGSSTSGSSLWPIRRKPSAPKLVLGRIPVAVYSSVWR